MEDKDLGVLKKRRVVVKQDEKERILKATWFAVTSVMTGTTTTVWGSKETCLNSGSASYARVPRTKEDINS